MSVSIQPPVIIVTANGISGNRAIEISAEIEALSGIADWMVPYSSRGVAQSAIVPDYVSTIQVRAGNGLILGYVSDSGATALTTGDGRKWRPTAPYYVEHYGANPNSGNPTAAIQAAANWLSAIGGGELRFQSAFYTVSAPISRPFNVRFVGNRPSSFVEPTNLAVSSSGTKNDLMPLLSTVIVADRSAIWATRRGVIECVNQGPFLQPNAGMQDIAVDASEISDHAIVDIGTSGANYTRCGAGWSLIADWPCGPGAGGPKTPFTQPMFDNCWCISTGRLYAGSGMNYLGGWLFWGDDRNLTDDLIDIFSNANQVTMIGCFARTPTGYGIVFENCDDIKVQGGTGSFRFASVDTITYGVKSSNPAKNYAARHIMINGWQGSMLAESARAAVGRAASSIDIVMSTGNSINITEENARQSTNPAYVLVANVANGASTTVPYPAGTMQADYVASYVSLTGSVWIGRTFDVPSQKWLGGTEYYVEKAGTDDVEVTFDASVITIKNNTGVQWNIGQTLWLDRINTLWDIPIIQKHLTGHNGGLTQQSGGTYGGSPVGAMVNRNSSFTVPSGVNIMLPFTTIDWMNVFGGFKIWDPDYPTKLWVPPGVHWVSLCAGVTYTGDPSGSRELHIVKNGYGDIGMGKTQTPGTTGGTNLNVFCPPQRVVFGDSFEIRLFQTSGVNVLATFNPSTFAAIWAC